jgi:hypothetical protein
VSSAEPFTDARELAERLAQWSHEGVTALGFALKLAGIDRDLLRAADEICRREIIPRLAEQDVDEFCHKNGRYMSETSARPSSRRLWQTRGDLSRRTTRRGSRRSSTKSRQVHATSFRA